LEKKKVKDMKTFIQKKTKSKLKIISYAKVRGKSEYYKSINELMNNRIDSNKLDLTKPLNQLINIKGD